MNKKTIITLILAIVAAISTRAIDAKHFYSGTAVLKGRILNKPADDWNVLKVQTRNMFANEDEVITIPVAYDGSFEANIRLLHSHSIYIVDIGQVFLAVGDTLELTKDAAQEEYKGFTFAGNNTSAVINRLWPELSKHYYGEEGLFIKGLERDKMPAWKKSVVKKLDAVIADIEADRLPLPANTTDFEKEVLGASLLSEPLMAMMENYRLNITGGNYSKMNIAEFGEYYDFVTDRAKWLLDNPAMLFIVPGADTFIGRVWIYMMLDISFAPHKAGESRFDYNQRVLQIIQKRYGLKNVDFMQQMVLSIEVFSKIEIDEDITPDDVAENFAAMIPFVSNPVVAHHALQRYRQYVKKHELKIVEQQPLTKADSIFQRIIEPYKGYGLFVHFWGMYCGPCRVEMQKEREKVEKSLGKPVRFLYICDEKESPREYSEEWMTENNIKGEHIYITHDEWNLLSAKFQFAGPPFATGVDKDGKIVPVSEINKYLE